jgi:hypothetical protein
MESASKSGTRVGHTRVSAVAQTLNQQNAALAAAGVTKVSPTPWLARRRTIPCLAALLDYVREGVVVAVWKLDRLVCHTLLGRSPTGASEGDGCLHGIVDEVAQRLLLQSYTPQLEDVALL